MNFLFSRSIAVYPLWYISQFFLWFWCTTVSIEFLNTLRLQLLLSGYRFIHHFLKSFSLLDDSLATVLNIINKFPEKMVFEGATIFQNCTSYFLFLFINSSYFVSKLFIIIVKYVNWKTVGVFLVCTRFGTYFISVIWN